MKVPVLKRSLGRVARSLAATAIAACLTTIASVGGALAADINLRLGHPLSTIDATQTAMLSFAENVSKRTDGRLRSRFFRLIN
jgi:TRAP-type C4-dicarboxylate transport system substrate-binding protein